MLPKSVPGTIPGSPHGMGEVDVDIGVLRDVDRARQGTTGSGLIRSIFAVFVIRYSICR